MRAHRLLASAVLLAALLAGRAVADTLFTFGAYSFDQEKTPDQATLLGNGVSLGGATFSAELPYLSNVPHHFPSNGPSGFNDALTLGRLAGVTAPGFSTNNVLTVRIPRGDLGANTRHGVALRWSGGRGIVNGPGSEFVLYESGNNPGLVENPMLRLRLGNGTWTAWHYFYPVTPFTFYPGEELLQEGAFATAYDLSAFGVPEGAAVYEIQLANLVAADRIDVPANVSPLAVGRVVPGPLYGAGDSSLALPDRGPQASSRTYDATSYDPDLLYLGVLPHTLMAPLPVAARVTAPAAGDPEQFTFSFVTEVGREVVLQCSTNLLDWTPVLTNPSSPGLIVHNYTAGAGPRCFFRAVER